MREGYKNKNRNDEEKSNALEKREDIRDRMITDGHLRFADDAEKEKAVKNDHVLDAVICCVAAADYLRGPAVKPSEDEKKRARKEGWIWVAEKQGSRSN